MLAGKIRLDLSYIGLTSAGWLISRPGISSLSCLKHCISCGSHEFLGGSSVDPTDLARETLFVF